MASLSVTHGISASIFKVKNVCYEDRDKNLPPSDIHINIPWKIRFYFQTWPSCRLTLSLLNFSLLETWRNIPLSCLMYVLCSDKLYITIKKKKKRFNWPVSQSYLRSCLLGYSPHWDSNITLLFLKSPSCPKNKYIKNRKAKAKKRQKNFSL